MKLDADPLSRLLTREVYGVDVMMGRLVAKWWHKTVRLLILDWMLPYKTGLEICQQLRSGDKLPCCCFLPKYPGRSRTRFGCWCWWWLFEALWTTRVISTSPRPFASFRCWNHHTNQRLKVADLELDCDNPASLSSRTGNWTIRRKSAVGIFYAPRWSVVITHRFINIYGKMMSSPVVMYAALIRLLRRKMRLRVVPLVHTVYGKVIAGDRSH